MDVIGEIKKCGIYKITSPKGRIYIGQSMDIYERWKKYKYINNKHQKKVFNSIRKYGVENHVFEIIEECEFDELNCIERYWQDFYNVLSENGLNLMLQECGEIKQVHSEETIEKMRAFHTGKQVSAETREKLRAANIGENSFWYGKNHSEKTKRSMSVAQTGGKNHQAKLVLQLETGIFYDTAKEASEACGMNTSTFYSYISGRVKNRSINYIYI